MSAPQKSDGDPARDTGVPRAVITDGLPSQLPDIDPDETQEWLDSLDAVVGHAGRARARYLMLRLLERSREQLAIVERIVSKHNGKVWAEAQPNEGATFFFSLPA